MVKLLTGAPNADLYSWEYKGGACKSAIRRVMCKPYSSPCMRHVSAFYFACVHISFGSSAPLHLRGQAQSVLGIV